MRTIFRNFSGSPHLELSAHKTDCLHNMCEDNELRHKIGVCRRIRIWETFRGGRDSRSETLFTIRTIRQNLHGITPPRPHKLMNVHLVRGRLSVRPAAKAHQGVWLGGSQTPALFDLMRSSIAPHSGRKRDAEPDSQFHVKGRRFHRFATWETGRTARPFFHPAIR